MTDASGAPTPKNSETDPPAANQPLTDADLDPDAEPDATSRSTAIESTGEPEPTPVPVAAPAGGQISTGKPDGEVDTSR
jgi:hypothetical protein